MVSATERGVPAANGELPTATSRGVWLAGRPAARPLCRPPALDRAPVIVPRQWVYAEDAMAGAELGTVCPTSEGAAAALPPPLLCKRGAVTQIRSRD